MVCRFIGLSYAASVEVSLSMKCHFESTNSTTKSSLSWHGMATVSNTLSRCLADVKAYEALTLPENDTMLKGFQWGVGGTESPMWARPTATLALSASATFPASQGQ
uniref:Uncharacterized protein n=1 Tax=Populus trichocarpa TaxID=3694 RepID=B9ILT8_POPTR